MGRPPRSAAASKVALDFTSFDFFFTARARPERSLRPERPRGPLGRTGPSGRPVVSLGRPVAFGQLGRSPVYLRRTRWWAGHAATRRAQVSLVMMGFIIVVSFRGAQAPST